MAECLLNPPPLRDFIYFFYIEREREGVPERREGGAEGQGQGARESEADASLSVEPCVVLGTRSYDPEINLS